MNEIEKLRSEVSAIDAKIISLIASRQHLAQQIGKYKEENNLPVVDSARESLLRQFHNELCEEHKLSSQMITKIFDILIAESRKVQQNAK